MSTSALLLMLALASQVEVADGDGLAPPRPAVDRFMGPRLGALLRARRSGNALAFDQAVRLHRPDLDDHGWVEVELIPDLPNSIDASVLDAMGLRVVADDGDRVTLRVQMDRIPALPDLVPGTAAVRLSPRAEPHAVSEGISLTGADVAHSAGARGQGTRLCIIDVGFKGLSGLVGSGAIPAPLIKKNYTSTGFEKSSNHGTAVTQTAHQMAPDASLILIKIANISDFEKAMEYAVQKKADVMNASLGFPGVNFSDGTGAAVKAVKKARDKGVLSVVSAGNAGDAHWLGAWSDPDKDKFLDFSTGDEGLTFATQPSQEVSVHLVWDDFPKTEIDLDLAVYYLGTDLNPQQPSKSNLMGYSTTVQNGSQPPFETVTFNAPVAGNYGAFVNRFKNKPSQVALFLSHTIKDGNNVAASSLSTPADAKQAVTVGAVYFGQWANGPLEAFSSRGPTTKGDPKPDIVGPDGTSTSVATLDPFFGTSAAAPHVAAAACVIKSQVPNLSVTMLKKRLLAYTQPIQGTQNEVGDGKVDLLADFYAPVADPTIIDEGASTAAATSVTVVVVAATDASTPIEYRVQYTGKKGQGGSNSGWTTSTTFVDDGLSPDSIYKYTAKARDAASIVNVTGVSSTFKIRTHAQVPPPPVVKAAGSHWIMIRVKPGDNPSTVEFALYNETDGTYVNPNGKAVGSTPVYRAASKWKSVQVMSLAPASTYQFRARARNSDGVESALSDAVSGSTL